MTNRATGRDIPDGSETFDPLKFPLNGRHLIEASAGTGKTYNIANLYLRLILGLGEGNPEPLTVGQILVVTFTRAAAGELRGRIRALLEKAYGEFRKGASEDEFINDLITMAGTDNRLMVRRLRDALLSMDEANISTIHKFAVKAAAAFLFETGAIADVEITQSGKERSNQMISDLYRQLITTGEDGANRFLKFACGETLEKFTGYYGGNLPSKLSFSVNATETNNEKTINELITEWSKISHSHEELRVRWFELFPENQEESETEFNKRIQGLVTDQIASDFKKANKGTFVALNLIKHFKKFLLLDTLKYVDGTGNGYFDKWSQLTQDNGSGAEFELFLRLGDHFHKLAHLINKTKANGRAAILQTLITRQSSLNLDQLSLDDVIRLINQRLDNDETRQDLRRIITQTYPVCLVDEFQDTDPEQFQMFNGIYEKSETDANIGFFMIGDPKQSIYAFRGADIFAYLNVRKEIRGQQPASDNSRIFTLDTNWRSKKALVDATNELFREPGQADSDREGVFLYEGIKYKKVASCEEKTDRKIDEYTVGKNSELSDHPLVFVLNPDDPEDKDKDFNKPSLLRKFARDTAARISALLDVNDGARLTDEKGNVNQEIRPGDMAVLVRSGTEARVIREELAKKEVGLRCVYLSQKDSVFSDSEISEDLYYILLAINEYADKRRLKSALATPLLRGFDFDFNEVDTLESDDSILESVIEEFRVYRELWFEHGILTALNRLIANPARGLIESIAKRHDSDRLLTDLRHLGDLLQQQDLQSDSAEQLIDWFATQLNDDSAMDEDSKRIRLESDEDLIKIVTIHVAKGLEYPIVFLPFFFMPWSISLEKKLPVYRQEVDGTFEAIADFSGSEDDIKKKLEREQLAEDMRFLYVAITRAIFQCYVGISSYGNTFPSTIWAHLLPLETNGDHENVNLKKPSCEYIESALEHRLQSVCDDVSCRRTGDVEPVRFRSVRKEKEMIKSEVDRFDGWPSHWQITSYSGLAKGKKLVVNDKEDDEEAEGTAPDLEIEQIEDDETWQSDIRYTLERTKRTGDCLHEMLEQRALKPGDQFEALVLEYLTRFDLDKPKKDPNVSEDDFEKQCQSHQAEVVSWLNQALAQPLLIEGKDGCPSLKELLEGKQVVPEMDFSFSIGNSSAGEADLTAKLNHINRALNKAGVEGIDRKRPNDISGLMNGSIDLVFVHNKKIYIADYKSNTLGKSHESYQNDNMTASIKDKRYDLQYMIYSVAAHRYFKRRLGDQYGYDDGEYSFGGVFYLYLRGMGYNDACPSHGPSHGIWYKRPEEEDIQALDAAFQGLPLPVEMEGQS